MSAHQRSTQHGGYSKGDPVRVILASGETEPSTIYTWHAHVVTELGNEWYELFGGDPDPRGRRQWRSVTVGSVRATNAAEDKRFGTRREVAA